MYLITQEWANVVNVWSCVYAATEHFRYQKRDQVRHPNSSKNYHAIQSHTLFFWKPAIGSCFWQLNSDRATSWGCLKKSLLPQGTNAFNWVLIGTRESTPVNRLRDFSLNWQLRNITKSKLRSLHIQNNRAHAQQWGLCTLNTQSEEKFNYEIKV